MGAANDESWDRAIEADMAQAKTKTGGGVGVLLIVLDSGEGPGFFGPVFSPAPTGEAVVKMWDAMVTASRIPGFYELKRPRETRPIFGERPTLCVLSCPGYRTGTLYPEHVSGESAQKGEHHGDIRCRSETVRDR
jgi:hypothetical protein